jgi:hypothetical protein
MGHFQTGAVVESQVAQGLPVCCKHAGWRCTQLLGHFAQSRISRRQAGHITPAARFDGLDQSQVTGLDTQKLCVGLRSIITILRRRGDPGNHLTLLPTQMPGFKHNLSI